MTCDGATRARGCPAGEQSARAVHGALMGRRACRAGLRARRRADRRVARAGAVVRREQHLHHVPPRQAVPARQGAEVRAGRVACERGSRRLRVPEHARPACGGRAGTVSLVTERARPCLGVGSAIGAAPGLHSGPPCKPPHAAHGRCGQVHAHPCESGARAPAPVPPGRGDTGCVPAQLAAARRRPGLSHHPRDRPLQHAHRPAAEAGAPAAGAVWLMSRSRARPGVPVACEGERVTHWLFTVLILTFAWRATAWRLQWSQGWPDVVLRQGPIRVVVGKPVAVRKLPPGVDVRSEEGQKCAALPGL